MKAPSGLRKNKIVLQNVELAVNLYRYKLSYLIIWFKRLTGFTDSLSGQTTRLKWNSKAGTLTEGNSTIV